MSIHEECGVFGAIAKTNLDIGNLVYYGLYALQHRGQPICSDVFPVSYLACCSATR